jgi:YD repeat-containing protein
MREPLTIGTNGRSAWTRPSTPPSASDTVLVSSDTYNPARWLGSSTDPRGLVEQYSYDNLGRTTQTIADHTNGTPTNNSNVTTQYGYDGNDNLVTYTAVEPGGNSQQTKYVYGVTTTGGSAVNSDDILSAGLLVSLQVSLQLVRRCPPWPMRRPAEVSHEERRP